MNKSAPTAMVDVASPELEKRIEESIAKAVPVVRLCQVVSAVT